MSKSLKAALLAIAITAVPVYVGAASAAHTSMKDSCTSDSTTCDFLRQLIQQGS